MPIGLRQRISIIRSSEQFNKEEVTTSEQTQQLTTTAVTSNVAAQVMRQTLPKADPYEDKTPKALLEREYLVYSATVGPDTPHFVWPFWELMQKATLKTVIKPFGLIRAGIKVRVSILSTPNIVGLIGVSALPQIAKGDVASWAHVDQQIQSNIQLLDISLGEEVTLELPYISQNLYQRPATPEGLWRVAIHTFDIQGVSSTATSTVTIFVHASLTDVETAGYQSPTFQMFGQSNLATAALGFGAKLLYDKGQDIAEEYLDKGIEGAKQAVFGQEEDPVSLSLVPDISTPKVGMPKRGSYLGEKRDVSVDIPNFCTDTKVSQVIRRPTLVSYMKLTTALPEHGFNVTPFPDHAHTTYLKSMFKYFRGGTDIFVKICCSPLIAASLVTTVYPMGYVGLNAQDIADLPTRITSIKGSTHFNLTIPYLQVTPWLRTDLNGAIEPYLYFKLAADLPAVFDTPSFIQVYVFSMPSADFRFAGYQSATFQMDLGQQFQTHSQNLPTENYQGGDFELLDLMARGSSRAADPSKYFPFPLQTIMPGGASGYDNFDWLNQLYKYYTGSCRVRVLFSKAPVSGVLTVASGNSVQGAAAFKAGNGIVTSHQSVWPILEYEQAYVSPFAFDSIWSPNGMYAPVFSAEAEVSEFWISSTNNFKVGVSLPVPNWFVAPNPPLAKTQGKEKARFQSGPPVFKSAVCRTQKQSSTVGAAFLKMTFSGMIQASQNYLQYEGKVQLNVAYTTAFPQYLVTYGPEEPGATNFSTHTSPGFIALGNNGTGATGWNPPESSLFNGNPPTDFFYVTIYPLDAATFSTVLTVNAVVTLTNTVTQVQYVSAVDSVYLPVTIKGSEVALEVVQPVQIAGQISLDPSTIIGVQGVLDPQYPVWTSAYQ